MEITPKESIEIILSEFPNFIEQWNKYLNDWKIETERPFGLDIAEFSKFAANIIEKGSDKEVEKLINLTELLITNGDEVLKERVKFEFLENITNKMEEIPIKRFTQILKPISKNACREIDAMWGTNTPGLE